MTFRKDSPFFYQCEIFTVFLAIIPIFMISEIGFLPLLVFSLPFCFNAVLFPLFQNEYITINEYGIRCDNTKTKKQLWNCKWSEISMLRRCSMYRCQAVSVLVYDKDGNPGEFNDGRYFLLGKTAKKALKIYAGDLWSNSNTGSNTGDG